MHQETPDKLFMAESDLPFRITGFLSARREGDFCFRDGKDPVVGDCNPVCIPSKILNCIAKSVKGLFDVRTPVLSVKTAFESFPFKGILQCFAGSGKHKLLLLMQRIQKCEIFPLELISQDSDRDEKFCGRFPDSLVRSKPASGDDAVHMDMVVQFLVPGVEHLDDPGLRSKVFVIGRQFQKSFGGAFMEQVVKKLLVTIDQGVKFMGECKHHMEVRGVNDFRPAFIHPDFFQDGLTVGAVPVAAGIVVERYMSAFHARTGIDSEPAGLTCQDSAGSFLLFF